MKKEKTEENLNKEQNENMNENNINLNEESEQTELNEENVSVSENDLLNNKIEELENEINNYKDKLLRKAAEFENYKRRTENDQLNLLKYAAESFIIKLLPVVDDFERSLQHIEKANDVTSIQEGVKLIYDKFVKTLNDAGVTKIESVGKPFDFNLHEALMKRPVDGVETDTVVDEVETGYMYKDKVIRHSKVVVSEETSNEENKGN